MIRQKIYFYKYVLVPVCRFSSSKELKTNFKQTRIHCAQVQHSWGHVTLTLFKPDTSLRRTAEAGPNGVRLRESWLYWPHPPRRCCYLYWQKEVAREIPPATRAKCCLTHIPVCDLFSAVFVLGRFNGHFFWPCLNKGYVCIKKPFSISYYLTIRLRVRVSYEQIVNEAQPSWLSLVENDGEYNFTVVSLHKKEKMSSNT